MRVTVPEAIEALKLKVRLAFMLNDIHEALVFTLAVSALERFDGAVSTWNATEPKKMKRREVV